MHILCIVYGFVSLIWTGSVIAACKEMDSVCKKNAVTVTEAYYMKQKHVA